MTQNSLSCWQYNAPINLPIQQNPKQLHSGCLTSKHNTRCAPHPTRGRDWSFSSCVSYCHRKLVIVPLLRNDSYPNMAANWDQIEAQFSREEARIRQRTALMIQAEANKCIAFTIAFSQTNKWQNKIQSILFYGIIPLFRTQSIEGGLSMITKWVHTKLSIDTTISNTEMIMYEILHNRCTLANRYDYTIQISPKQSTS